MCGRFVITSSPEALRRLFGYSEQPNLPPRYNVAPTQPIPVVPAGSTEPQVSGFCFLLREPNVWLCQSGFLLPRLGAHFTRGGQIQGRGLMDFNRPEPFQGAIDGGFGDYDSAGGLIDATFPPTPTGGKPRSRWEMTIRTP